MTTTRTNPTHKTPPAAKEAKDAKDAKAVIAMLKADHAAVSHLFAGYTKSGLVAWAWFAMTKVEEELRSFTGVGGLRFDI